MSVLDGLVAEAHVRANRLDLAVVRRRAGFADPARNVMRALSGAPGLGVIAEVKRQSPSAGVIAGDLDPVRQAIAYASGGATAISILTEPDHFGGSLDDLRFVRTEVDLPILRKDFIVAPEQVYEARVAGADALLLIVAALDQQLLKLLIKTTEQTGMTPLVEVHDTAEAQRAMEAGARLVGVNNRNLATFEVDLTTAESVAPSLAADVLTVAESGIKTGEDARRMEAAGYRAVLVGEALVRTADPAALVAELAGVAA
ncbi:MAG: indole-3-glycerol phosphate synthase TrpC [Acidimicrobiia bacterium]|nr:indole-3-glycerol phosphate synthase TrpC [Acidimicrobiia bacterium]